MENLNVKLTSLGKEYDVSAENKSGESVKIDELVVYSEKHGYAPSQRIYGEGFQMLCQSTGTVEKSYCFTMQSDEGHYKLPAREGFNTVYNLLAVQKSGSVCDMYAFTSCSRFKGKIYFNNETIEMVLDLEGMTIAPNKTIELEKSA